MIMQPPGVPDDGTSDDCVASGPLEAVTLALAEYTEHGEATKTGGVSIGDQLQMPDLGAP